jgi:hypothetical protein
MMPALFDLGANLGAVRAAQMQPMQMSPPPSAPGLMQPMPQTTPQPAPSLPQTLFGNLEQGISSPLFLAGLGLATNGSQGLMQGLQTGNQLRQLPLERMVKEAQAQKYMREAREGGFDRYGKTGAVFQGRDGRYYTVQFGGDGSRKVVPMDDGMTPARGTYVVGDEVIDKATGAPVRNVGSALTQGEVAKGEGQNIAKTRAELPEARQRLTLVTGGLDRIKSTASSLASMPGLDSVVGGLYQAYTPNVSEKSLNAQTELENLKVKISGAVLQNMRDMSKTGGAVGQVTEREWPRLENMISNLDTRQGKEQFLANLRQVNAYVDEVKAAIQRAYEDDLRVAQGAGPTMTPAQPQQMPAASPLKQKYGLE